MVLILTDVSLEDVVDGLVSSLYVTLALWVKGGAERVLNMELVVHCCYDIISELRSPIGT